MSAVVICCGFLIFIHGAIAVTITTTAATSGVTQTMMTTTAPPPTTTKHTKPSTEHTTPPMTTLTMKTTTMPPTTTAIKSTTTTPMPTTTTTTKKATTTTEKTSTSTTTKSTTTGTDSQFPIVNINGKLVRLLYNCTVGDPSSCPNGFCCTKQFVSYPAGYTGTKVSYELRCDPLRRSGEFCYYRTPDNFCPCSTQCHTNGFYGTCL